MILGDNDRRRAQLLAPQRVSAGGAYYFNNKIAKSAECPRTNELGALVLELS